MVTPILTEAPAVPPLARGSLRSLVPPSLWLPSVVGR